MKAIVTNLTNSPFSLEGGLFLPAMGSVSGDFAPEYLEVLRVSPGVRVRDVERRVPDVSLLSDEDLRDLIERRTGKRPHHKTGRAKLEAAING